MSQKKYEQFSEELASLNKLAQSLITIGDCLVFQTDFPKVDYNKKNVAARIEILKSMSFCDVCHRLREVAGTIECVWCHQGVTNLKL